MSFSRHNIIARSFQATEYEVAKAMDATSMFMPKMQRLYQAMNHLGDAVENVPVLCYHEPGSIERTRLQKVCKDIRRAQIALGMAILFPLRPNDESPEPFGTGLRRN